MQSNVELGKPRKGLMISKGSEWRKFAEQVTKETDPARLLLLITKLNDELKRDRLTRKPAGLIAAVPAFPEPLDSAL